MWDDRSRRNSSVAPPGGPYPEFRAHSRHHKVCRYYLPQAGRAVDLDAGEGQGGDELCVAPTLRGGSSLIGWACTYGIANFPVGGPDMKSPVRWDGLNGRQYYVRISNGVVSELNPGQLCKFGFDHREPLWNSKPTTRRQVSLRISVIN